MADRLDANIMAVLLKSIYRQNLISEDVYNHSLNNLSKMSDDQQGLGYEAATKEGGSNGCVPN